MSRRRAVIDFLVAVLLLGISLLAAVGSEMALERGERRLGVTMAVLALLIALTVSLVFVPRLARRVDFSRWSFPFSFQVTREGGFFILLVFLLSLAAINTGNNLLFLIIAVLLATIVASGVAARWSLHSVSVGLQVPENVYEGERVSVRVALHNPKRWCPAFSILVEDSLTAPGSAFWTRVGSAFRSNRSVPADPGGAAMPEGQAGVNRSVLRHPAYFPFVPPGESRSELVPQFFPKRGRYRLEGFRVSTRFPFGFFRRAERVPVSGEILVYPSVREVSDYFHLLPFLPGRLEGNRTGPGESLYSIREYKDGDSVRQIDWKATARTGELMTREFAREEETKFCLILDTALHAPVPPDASDRFETAVSVAASLFEHFCAEGAELELATPAEYVPRGMGPAHLYRILRSLAVVECTRADPRGPAPPRGSAAAGDGRGPDARAVASVGGESDLSRELAGVLDQGRLDEMLTDKVFKVILTSRPRGTFPSAIWRSSHVIYFDEL